jgi:hypothetical protein
MRFNSQSPVTADEGNIGAGLTSARTYIYNGSTVSGFDDGSSTVQITSSGGFTPNMIFGRSSAVDAFETFEGTVAEFIIYASDQSANRFKIESNINNYYGIYTAAEDGFVETWYDQSGNGNHAVQDAVEGYQPKIVSAGSFILERPNTRCYSSGFFY